MSDHVRCKDHTSGAGKDTCLSGLGTGENPLHLRFEMLRALKEGRENTVASGHHANFPTPSPHFVAERIFLKVTPSDEPYTLQYIYTTTQHLFWMDRGDLTMTLIMIC